MKRAPLLGCLAWFGLVWLRRCRNKNAFKFMVCAIDGIKSQPKSNGKAYFSIILWHSNEKR